MTRCEGNGSGLTNSIGNTRRQTTGKERGVGKDRRAKERGGKMSGREEGNLGGEVVEGSQGGNSIEIVSVKLAMIIYYRGKWLTFWTICVR